jgi:muramidase (phage lysozyme)
MATIEELAGYAKDPRVRRFLDVISAAEGTDTNGYSTAFGGGKLESLADHPRQLANFTQTDGKANKTSAAGRYQFLQGTWDDVAKNLNLPDFGPESQDIAAVELLRRNGALPALLADDYETAVQKSGSTWASLPSSPYAQPKRSPGFIAQALDRAAQAVFPSAQAAPAPDLSGKVKAARDAGYSDDEIYDHLSQSAGFSDRVKRARDAGYSDAEIYQHLGLQPATATPAQATAPSAATAAEVAPVPTPTQPPMAQEAPLATSPSESRGGIGGGAFMGAIRDPLDAGAQMLVRGVRAASGIIPDALGGETARRFMDEQVADVDRQVRTANQEYDQSRAMAGREGFDAARLAGNVVSPANIPVARMMGGANTLMQLAGRGAAAGATGAVLQPVVNQPGQSEFWGTKGGQALGGAVAGAVLTPVASRVADFLGNQAAGIAQRLRGRFTSQADVDGQILRAIQEAGPEMGIRDLSEIPENVLAGVRQQVQAAMRSGEVPDPAALVRRADFDTLSIPPTRGQVTRDPMQFATERNMRGIDLGGGRNPLADRFSEQNRLLVGEFDRMGAAQADTPFSAGNSLMNALREADAPARAAVDDAYNAARGMAGVNADIPAAPLAQRYGEVLSDFGNDVLPGAVRQRLERIGLADGRQTAALTVGDAEDIIRVINRNYDPMNRVQARALDELRAGVLASVDDLAAAGSQIGPEAAQAFSAARGVAADRFGRIESSPALKAALDGADPEKFVQKYLLGATTEETRAMGRILANDEGAIQQARAQVAEYLRSAAFGPNATGDTPMAVSRYMSALQKMGREKLSALFSPEEVARLEAVGRVGQYITTQPAGAAVNNSNTASATMNLLAEVSGPVGQIPFVRVLRDQLRAYGNERAANAALTGQPASQAAQLPPELRNRLLPYLSAVPIAGGVSAGATLK